MSQLGIKPNYSKHRLGAQEKIYEKDMI